LITDEFLGTSDSINSLTGNSVSLWHLSLNRNSSPSTQSNHAIRGHIVGQRNLFRQRRLHHRHSQSATHLPPHHT
jgi:hypothetical protein